jgi:hypothetical protein
MAAWKRRDYQQQSTTDPRRWWSVPVRVVVMRLRPRTFHCPPSRSSSTADTQDSMREVHYDMTPFGPILFRP